jgi:hypothetical protein
MCAISPSRASNVDVSSATIIGGPGELTFAQRYDVKLRLPIPESDFLKILAKNKLRYSVVTVGDDGNPIPVPRHSKIRLNNIVRYYQIYGDIDRLRRVGAMYRAYIDSDKTVVYIENVFSYTGA